MNNIGKYCLGGFGDRGIFVLVFFFHNSLYFDCRDHLFFRTTGDELFGALGN